MDAINKTWILLDTCSMHSVSNSNFFVTNIQKCGTSDILSVVTNGGPRNFGHSAMLKILPIKVHFDPTFMATILSMKDVANIFDARLNMDTQLEQAIIVEACKKSSSLWNVTPVSIVMKHLKI